MVFDCMLVTVFIICYDWERLKNIAGKINEKEFFNLLLHSNVKKSRVKEIAIMRIAWVSLSIISSREVTWCHNYIMFDYVLLPGNHDEKVRTANALFLLS